MLNLFYILLRKLLFAMFKLWCLFNGYKKRKSEEAKA